MKLFTLLFILYATQVEAAPSIEKYWQYDAEFMKKVCTPKDVETWNALNTEYRGEGFYLPSLPNDHLDRETIKAFLPELEGKVIFIQKKIDYLLKKPDFTLIKDNINYLRMDLLKLLKFKEELSTTKLSKQKRKATQQMAKLFYLEFKKRVFLLYEDISLFHGFRFPMDHLSLRSRYDSTKLSGENELKKRANRTYMIRKMVEDGAQDPDHRRNDMFLRTTLNTLYLMLEKDNSNMITEDIRFDLEYIFDQVEKQLNSGHDLLIARHQEWHERISKQVQFYHKILGDYDKRDIEEGEKLVKEMASVRGKFEEFVLKKQSEVYEFWSQKPIDYEAIYAMDSILFNEVGSVDPSGVERADVLHVVFNRIDEPRFSTLTPKDKLYKHLPADKIKDHPWLNALLKEGEFSFSYFFITGNLKIFCPDNTRDGKKLRNENLKIIQNALTKKSPRFKATHYFSRASMVGHIDMSSLWSDLEVIPERKGPRLKDKKEVKKILSLIKKGDATFYYRFFEGRFVYDVYAIDKMPYVTNATKTKVYTYRSPHLFRYFAPKKRSEKPVAKKKS